MREAFAHFACGCRDLDDFFGTRKGLSDAHKLVCALRVRVTCRAVLLFRAGSFAPSCLRDVVGIEWAAAQQQVRGRFRDLLTR